MRKQVVLIISGFLLVLIGAVIVWTRANSAELPVSPSRALWSPFAQPIHNWRVCEDLGIGAVPGIPDQRQRFRLCHNQGWELITYCLQPNQPAPKIGTICSRVNEDTFWCGNGIQNLRLYAVLQTPTPTPTSTTTPSPSPTPSTTPSPTPTVTQPLPTLTSTPRPKAGGMGNLGYEGQKNVQQSWSPTKTPFQPSIITRTPFQPIHPTPLQHHLSTKTPELPSSNFNGIDFNDLGQWLHIKIIPPDKRVNRGKPIVISFIPGQNCNYGDQRACISTYKSTMESEIVFITVHSGVEGEGQAFRHAVEGTGINSAAFSLKKVRNNLRALDGAEVVIIQGENRFDGYMLVATARIPPVSMDSYFKKPIEDALSMASSIDPSLNDWVDPILPQIVFETCGWRIIGERWAPGISSTTASVYIGVIQKKP